jgi:glyoxylase-like metal-dependent hydrolase (beta-lactamase superfamily II)
MMLGTITLSQRGDLSVHTYTAPEDGWRVNSHIIELPTRLLVIDAQYTLPYAGEVVAYARTLGKPVSRLYITHYHPDHLLGAVAFQAPIYALAEVKAKIEAVGDRVASEEHEKRGDIIPARAERPGHIVASGIESIDGVRIEFIHLRDAETADALMVGLPDHRMLITQDLLYNATHVFVGEKTFDPWLATLETYRSLSYERILPGHGSPGGLELYDGMLHYLSTARDEYANARNADELKQHLFAIFPEHAGRLMVDHEMRFLFPR